jgi:hypothetical protein
MHSTLSKQQLALAQIQRALLCYGTHKDFVSAITLAGAADELCGAELKRRGITHALDDHVEILQGVEGSLGYPVTDQKKWHSDLNWPRNELKHWNDASVTSLTLDWQEEARDLIERAITNFTTLYEDHVTDEMRDFLVTSEK